MAKRFTVTMLLLAAVLICVAGCRNYGYRPAFAGGPHIGYKPYWPIPVFINHGPVPYEELKEVYPPQLNISSK